MSFYTHYASPALAWLAVAIGWTSQNKEQRPNPRSFEWVFLLSGLHWGCFKTIVVEANVNGRNALLYWIGASLKSGCLFAGLSLAAVAGREGVMPPNVMVLYGK